MEQYLDVEKLSKKFKSIDYHNTDDCIETTDILDCLSNYNIRTLQRWARGSYIKYKRVHGRKVYLWNRKDIHKLERHLNKEPKRKPYKRRLEKDSITFITIKDIVDELYNKKLIGKMFKNIYNLKSCRWEDTYIEIKRYNVANKIYIYCKYKNCKKEKHFGREYYVISEELKTEIISDFGKGYKDALRIPGVRCLDKKYQKN